MQPVGLWTTASEVPGPHVAVTGLVHGDEPCGRIAIQHLRSAGITPARGRLSLCLVNLEAEQTGRRFLDRDINRLWRDDWIDTDEASLEIARARELRSWLRTVDMLLDLHTTAFVARPFFVIADQPKCRALADAMGFPDAQQLMPGGCVDGRHLTDYGRFADPADPACAVTVECGRHDDAAAGDVAWRTALRFLEVTGTLTSTTARALGAALPTAAIDRFRTSEPCIARTDDFRLTVPLSGFVGVRSGQVVATDGGRPVVAPRDAVIVSPRPAPLAGTTAFLWSERIAA